MRWFADNSELNGIRGSQIPDMLLFGGVAVPPEVENELRNTIESVKAKYGHARAPVKWNFKDLKKLYEKQKMTPLYEKLISSSREWRTEIFEETKNFDYTIIISVVQSYSVDRKVIKDVKESLSRFVFSNGLMRVALHASEIKADRYQIILDWPDGGNSQPFDMEYASAFNDGKTRGGHVGYHSGPLRKLGFMDSAVYANMYHSTLLQFADLVVGATREFIECSIGKKDDGFGKEVCKIIAPRFRGYKGNVFGRGISVASGEKDFRLKIRDYINQELG